MPYKLWVPEKSAAIIRLEKPTVSTDTFTVTASAVDRDENVTALGSADGAVAGQDILITMDISQITPGKYQLEVVATKNGSNPVTLIPNRNTRKRVILEVGQIRSVAD